MSFTEEKAREARQQELAQQQGQPPSGPQVRMQTPQQADPAYAKALRAFGVLQIFAGVAVTLLLATTAVTTSERMTQETLRSGVTIDVPKEETIVHWPQIGASVAVLLASVAGAVVMFALADVLRRSAATTRELEKIQNLLS